MAGTDGELRRGASAKQRVIEAVRRHYRRLGGSPSLRELQAYTGIALGGLRDILGALERDGLIRRQKGKARGILLVDRMAMGSDTELELEARRRGGTLTLPKATALPLAEAFASVLETHSTLPLASLLAQIDAADTSAGRGDRHGGTGGGQG